MKKILVVDDTKTNINILVELLAEQYDVVVALNGKSALDILKEERVDLILLDIMMPDMDGFEVCRRIKQNSDIHDIPIIFITAKSDEESIEKGYEIGGADYITKPFKPRELLAKILREFKLQDTIHYLEYISFYDQMTGIFNRRKFFELGKKLFKEHSYNLFAVMVDIDNFKIINDTYGHSIGDEVIKCVTKTIQNSLNKEAVFGRLGGEEFAILLDFPSSKNIHLYIESIRKQIENKIILDKSKEVKFTISVGIAQKNFMTQNIDELLKVADMSLYQAKGEGRNRVIFRS